MVVGGKCQSKRTEEENCQETKANCEVCSRDSLGRALEKALTLVEDRGHSIRLSFLWTFISLDRNVRSTPACRRGSSKDAALKCLLYWLDVHSGS